MKKAQWIDDFDSEDVPGRPWSPGDPGRPGRPRPGGPGGPCINAATSVIFSVCIGDNKKKTISQFGHIPV